MALLLLFNLISLYIIFFKRKYILFYFFAIYPILPDYFALELGGGLPLLKASRILILALLVSVLVYNRGKIYLPLKGIKKIKIFWPMILYFSGRIIANIFYVFNLSEAINTEFSIIFEQLILMIVVVQLIHRKDQILQCINGMVCGSGIVACLSIASVIYGENIFYHLNCVSRNMLMASTTRLGIIRAEAGFGHPVYYGVYCALIIPIAYYIYENKKNVIYLIICGLDIIALLLTESRGSIVALIFMIIITFLRMSKVRRQKIIRIIGSVIIVTCILFILIPSVREQIEGIFNSIFAIVNTNIVIEDFGENSTTGLDSRLIQLTGVYWTILNNALFGLGASCHTRGVLKYYKEKIGWFVTSTIDNGYVGYFVQEGIIGTIGFFSLIISLIKISNKLSEKRDKKNLNNTFFICFFVYAIEMFSVADSSQTFWLIIILFVCYNTVDIIKE